jgi:hypothetical protein
MSDHPDSIPAFKSLGELTGNIVDKLREARAPTIDDVQADMGRLLGLIEVIDDVVFDVSIAGELSRDDGKKLVHAQHLAHIAVHFAKYVDAQLDAVVMRRAAR